MKAEYLSKIIAELIELIDEGVYIVDQDGVGRFYNKAMASMEKVNIEDVLGKKFHEAFPDFSLNDSTMFEALKKNNATLRKQQTYKNLYGKEITTINSTIPIIADGQTVAAVEIAKDYCIHFRLPNISDWQSLTRTWEEVRASQSGEETTDSFDTPAQEQDGQDAGQAEEEEKTSEGGGEESAAKE